VSAKRAFILLQSRSTDLPVFNARRDACNVDEGYGITGFLIAPFGLGAIF
jgi:hypothetical protein